MKAYEIRAPTGFDALTLAERPMPEPGEHEALVRIHATSLNYRDLLVAKGAYSRRLPLPLVPLSDAAGEVVEVGSAVTRVRAGDRVMPIFMQRWIDGELDEAKARSALGAATDGVLAEYAVFHEEGLVPVPTHLSYEEAATLPCGAVTAWHALVVRGGLTRGDSLLVLGSGGVSVLALQIATVLGARVIATSKSDEKRARLRALGASDTINYADTPAWDEAVRSLTGGTGVDHVLEVGGAGTFARSLRAVRMGGRISLIGVVAGGGDVGFIPIFMRGLTVQGIFVGSRVMFEALGRFVGEHGVRPVVDRVFTFAQAVEAYHYMESAQHVGKIVVRVTP